MMISTCRHCKFWGQVQRTRSDGEPWRECTQLARQSFAPLAQGSESWGDATGVETAPDFGCIHFEDRVPPGATLREMTDRALSAEAALAQLRPAVKAACDEYWSPTVPGEASRRMHELTAAITELEGNAE